jgi:hypothetical protein
MQRQRFELKYLVDSATAEAIRDVVSTHLDLDEAGVGKPNFAYRVNSLYLDSDSLCTMWDWVNSNRNRFKLRMRYYDEKPDTPVFTEIKRRVSGCILKQRCGIRKDVAHLVLAGHMPNREDILSRDAKGYDALLRFVEIVAQLSARPKALVTYLREAYIDPYNDAVRVTLDRQVRIAPRETCDFSLQSDRYAQPFGNRVILELKFTNRYPDWFQDMVELLNLSRGAAAKYCEGMAALWTPELGNCARPPVRQRRRTSFIMDDNGSSNGDGAPMLTVVNSNSQRALDLTKPQPDLAVVTPHR